MSMEIHVELLELKVFATAVVSLATHIKLFNAPSIGLPPFNSLP